MFDKLKNLITGTATRAMGKGAMVTTCHALGWAIYADGVVEEAELISAKKSAKNKPRLAAFGGEFDRTLEGVLNAFEDSPRMAKIEAKRAIGEFMKTATVADREDVIIQTLDLLESDGQFGEDEKAMVTELASLLQLDIKKYL